MRANPTKSYQVKKSSQRQNKLDFGSRKMQRNGERMPIADITLGEIFQRIYAGLQRLWVSVKYRFYQLTAGFFDQIRFPWFKLGLAALTIFILTKKDIQFSINMRAPLAGMTDRQTSDDEMLNELSMVKTMHVSAPLRNNEADLPNLADLNDKKAQAYIKRFSKVATVEMEKFGIPASIKLAQGLLESRAGEHSTARQTNNHFGAPLANETYDSAWENWRAHSRLIAAQYAYLISENSNYKQWAKELEKTKYNPAKAYAEKLIEIIEYFQLYQLD